MGKRALTYSLQITIMKKSALPAPLLRERISHISQKAFLLPHPANQRRNTVVTCSTLTLRTNGRQLCARLALLRPSIAIIPRVVPIVRTIPVITVPVRRRGLHKLKVYPSICAVKLYLAREVAVVETIVAYHGSGRISCHCAPST